MNYYNAIASINSCRGNYTANKNVLFPIWSRVVHNLQDLMDIQIVTVCVIY